MLYDDFFTDLVQKGKAHVKKFWAQNKDELMSMLKTMALTYGPKLLSIGGSEMKSSDPYSVDVNFLSGLFDQELQSGQPAPRMLLDPLGTWRAVTQYQVSTNSQGRAIVTVCPQSALYGIPTGPSVAWFPYVSTNATNGDQVYTGATWNGGAFGTEQTSTVGFLPDVVKTYFTSTLSVLNAAGRIFCGVFY